ncbi:MAG: hypothetical protein EA412_00430 [Chitinophagaceae bacterium]|nr:MAG: hypothetical protein EA412_00430 [Chitinophagaceae bacterium]
MKKIPTDLEILQAIYSRYNLSYKEHARKEPDRITRVRVPVDIGKIAQDCGVEEDMIFGRLYYHFNKKYSYFDEDGNRVTFFSSLKFEGLSVNFPLVLSILADLDFESRKFKLAITFSTVALVISVFALILAFII